MTPDLFLALDIAILVAAGALTLLLALLLSLLLRQPAARRPGRWGNRFFGLVCATPPTSRGRAAPVGRRLRLLASPRAVRRLKEILSKPGTKGYHGVAARDVAAASGA